MDIDAKQKEYNELERDFVEKTNQLIKEYRAKVGEIFLNYEKNKQDEVRRKLGI